MADDPTKFSLPEILTGLDKVAQDTRRVFGGLSAEQVNWKPGPDQWSVGQCFDHLILANESYYPIIEQVARGEYQKTFWQSMPVLPSLFKKMLFAALNPKSTQKFKAPKNFQPASSDLDPRIIDRFAAHQGKYCEMIKSTEGRDHEKIIISSPASSAITYSLMDAFRITLIHEHRHFNQAERVMQTQGFPI